MLELTEMSELLEFVELDAESEDDVEGKFPCAVADVVIKGLIPINRDIIKMPTQCILTRNRTVFVISCEFV